MNSIKQFSLSLSEKAMWCGRPVRKVLLLIALLQAGRPHHYENASFFAFFRQTPLRALRLWEKHPAPVRRFKVQYNCEKESETGGNSKVKKEKKRLKLSHIVQL